MLSARQLTGAAPGGYTVNVSTLASADSRTYACTPAAAPSTIAYNAGDADTTQTKTFDLTGMSLDDAVTTINSAPRSPVWAVNVSGKLSLSRRETGDHDTWGFDASGTAVGAPTASRDGEDATYTVAGDATIYSSHNDVASEGLPGVELTLQVDRHDDGHRLGAGRRPRRRRGQAQGLRHRLQRHGRPRPQQADREAVANPQSDADARWARCSATTPLRHAVADAPVDLGGRLDDLGVTVPPSGSGNSPDALAGKLTFDQADLRRRVGHEPGRRQGRARLADAGGFAQSFEELLDPIVRSGDGLIDQRVRAADHEIKSIQDSLARWTSVCDQGGPTCRSSSPRSRPP